MVFLLGLLQSRRELKAQGRRSNDLGEGDTTPRTSRIVTETPPADGTSFKTRWKETGGGADGFLDRFQVRFPLSCQTDRHARTQARTHARTQAHGQTRIAQVPRLRACG